MSKTYLSQVEKVKMLAEGVRSHYDLAKQHGITIEQLDKMLHLSEEAIALNYEVDQLRTKTSEKVREANALLSELKATWMPVRSTIKSAYEQTEWSKFGLLDKR